MRLLFSIVIIANFCGCMEQPPIKTGFEGKKLPGFTFLLSDSVTRFYTDSIKEGKSFAIFYFNPDCPYCRAEIRDIINHHDQLNNTKFYLLTNYPYTETNKIIKDLKLNEYRNIITALDSNNEFIKYFYIPEVPYVAIYDKEKRLKQVLVGKTQFSTIQKMIDQ